MIRWQNDKKTVKKRVDLCSKLLPLLLIEEIYFFYYLSMNWVKVENAMSAYLPNTTETRQGLDRMEEEFVTYGTAKVMVTNISYPEAEDIAEEIDGLDTVIMLTFDNTTDHYNNFSALYDVTFAYEETDDRALMALEEIEDRLEEYDIYVSTSMGDASAEQIASEMQVISILVAIVVVSVLLLTSETWAEVPVLLITFCAAALITKGTNFMMGTISFVSDSVTIVLQLALSIDYAVIFCNRYKEERQKLSVREANIMALSKAIPEISSSSLTTVGGLIAMMFMQFGIGSDMALCLIRAIVLSLLSVFLLMPGLIMLFGRAMDKTKHKSFIPKIPFVGRFAYATKHIMPPLFLALIIVAYIVSSRCPYVYGYTMLETPVKSDAMVVDEMITESFGDSNMVALIVPAGNYDKEKQLLAELDAREEIDNTMGLANTEAMDGYMLTQLLTPRAFSELLDMDVEVAELLYTAYAVNDSNLGAVVNGISEYELPLIDIFLYIYDQKESGNITLDEELEEMLGDAYSQISIAQDQLLGEDYSRFVLELRVPSEGEETYEALEEIRRTVARYYDPADIYLAGVSTSNRDLSHSFSTDNVIITILTAVFVMIILLFTFQSAGLPVLLVLTIQGSIWVNFSLPYLQQEPVYFLGYLVVSAIQMGATIDYAIVITSRYMELKTYMSIKEAIVLTLNQAFPTIVTSGSMLVAAGFIINNISTNAVVAAIGLALGRGTLTSIAMVLLVLPQTLLLGDILIEKTAFTLKREVAKPLPASGRIRMTGHIKGYVNGVIDGDFTGVIDGEMGAVIRARDMYENARELLEYREEDSHGQKG